MADMDNRKAEYEEILSRLRALKEDGTAPRLAAIDPTLNVTQLVSAETKRQDDLRVCEIKRIDDLQRLRAIHDEKMATAARDLAIAEAKRIDAIRAVDVAAVGTASERASQQAIVLANQVSASAETLRSLVATTASTVAQQLQQVSSALAERLAALEKSQYETKGSSGTPPVWHQQTVERMESMERKWSELAGRSAGTDTTIATANALRVSSRALLFAIIASVASMLGVFMALFKLFGK